MTELRNLFITDKNTPTQHAEVGAQGDLAVSIRDYISGNKASIGNQGQLYASILTLDEDSEYSNILGDTIFKGAIIALQPEHHEIHCGDSYIASRTVDVAGSSIDEVLIIVPNEPGSGQSQKLYHLVMEGICEAEGQWDFYEGPTYSAIGTAINSFNKNRNISNTDYLGVYYGPTISTDGTLIESIHIGSGRSVGGESRADEWVLKNNTLYLIRFTNAIATANFITLRLKYYVHPGV